MLDWSLRSVTNFDPLGRIYIWQRFVSDDWPGWDNVTGPGTPNGLSFVEDVVAASKAAKNVH